MPTINKHCVQQGMRWSIFLLAALTVSLKIAEVSAYETTKLIMTNPELGEYSQLVANGYLPF